MRERGGGGRGRASESGERREPRAIVIKHRELAKLRCNLAGDVLPRCLARRGPPAAPIHMYVSYARARSLCVVEERGGRAAS